MGPTALAVSPQGQVYVARFDFKESNKNGLISVLNGETGMIDEELVLPDCSEMTGLFFSKVADDILYATESSTNSLLKIQVNSRNWIQKHLNKKTKDQQILSTDWL